MYFQVTSTQLILVQVAAEVAMVLVLHSEKGLEGFCPFFAEA